MLENQMVKSLHFVLLRWLRSQAKKGFSWWNMFLAIVILSHIFFCKAATLFFSNTEVFFETGAICFQTLFQFALFRYISDEKSLIIDSKKKELYRFSKKKWDSKKNRRNWLVTAFFCVLDLKAIFVACGEADNDFILAVHQKEKSNVLPHSMNVQLASTVHGQLLKIEIYCGKAVYKVHCLMAKVRK